MKKSILSILAVATLMLTSCGSDDNGGGNGGNTIEPIVELGETNVEELVGTITSSRALDASKKYLVTGSVLVKSGATLTIPAGTTIYVEPGQTDTYIAVEQGAKIIADGTSNKIVFTSNTTDPQAGDWGGIVIAGKTQTNKGDSVQSEVAGLNYGKSAAEAVSDDNSGVLKNIIVEYTGAKINGEQEFNGLSLYTVGSGTQIANIVLKYGADDGIEFFGGTVNLKYAIVTGAGDDSFDWTDGWIGNGQFWIAQQTSAAGDKGIEADNLSSTPDATPFSNPILSNITLIGAEDGDGENKGIEFRAGTKVSMYNTIIKAFPGKGIEVDDDQTLTNLNNNEIIVRNTIIDNVKSFDLDHGGATVDLADFALFNNYTLSGSGDPFNNPGTAVPDAFEINGFRGSYGYTVANDTVDNFDPATLGAFFTSTNYVGALKSDDTWTSDWTRL